MRINPRCGAGFWAIQARLTNGVSAQRSHQRCREVRGKAFDQCLVLDGKTVKQEFILIRAGGADAAEAAKDRRPLPLAPPTLTRGPSLRARAVRPRALASSPARGALDVSGPRNGMGDELLIHRPQSQWRSVIMSEQDPELERLRAEVNCAAVLEQAALPWRLDRQQSTQHCLKYRRGAGEILIVNHDGQGWWDPQSEAKGDVFDLVQYLHPKLNFGEVRKALRPFIGLAPSFPEALPQRHRDQPDKPVAERWALRPQLKRGSQAWRYLMGVRRLPIWLLLRATEADVVREGFYGGAWFAHRDEDGAVTHVEARGPQFKGSLKGGIKTLFRFSIGAEPKCRLVLAEAPIDALSLAAIERLRPDSFYLATGGGMGPATLAAIERALELIRAVKGAVLCGASDANPTGERYASKHHALAEAVGVPFERLRPSISDGDWNDVLQASHQSRVA